MKPSRHKLIGIAASLLFAWCGAPGMASAEMMATVLLIPGAGSSGTELYVSHLNWTMPLLGGSDYFKTFQKALNKRNIPSHICPRNPDRDERSIEERAEECAQFILSLNGQECTATEPRRIVLMGHSMGGLVARTLARDPRVEGCIQSVTTISTPHRGTPLADFAIERNARDRAGFDLFGKLFQFIHFTPEHLAYLRQLQVDRRGLDPSIFRAQDLEDNPQIRYYSVVNAMNPILIPPLALGRWIISKELKKRGLDDTPYGTANDGVVPAYSMVHGTVVAELPIHHWASACVDTVRRTPECKRALRAIMPHLEVRYSEALDR